MKLIDKIKHNKKIKSIDKQIMDNLKLNAESLKIIHDCNEELASIDEQYTQRYEELLFEIKVQSYYIYNRKRENKKLIKEYTDIKDLARITTKVNNYLYSNGLVNADI